MDLRKRNILTLLQDRTCDYENRIALGMKNAFGWKELTYKGIGLLSRKLARHLIEDIEVKKGERLAILSESKPEYGVCVFASVLSGMITVPLDVKLTIYELKSILQDCEPSVITVSQHQLPKAIELQKEIPSIRRIIVMDEHSHNIGIENLYDLADAYDAKWRHRSSKSTAFIIYTSGTTGAPKGVEISFRNIVAQIEDLTNALNNMLPVGNLNVLSILPMNHLYEMTLGFCTLLSTGNSIYYTQSLKPKDIFCIMRERKIQYMTVVPAFLKLLRMSLEADIKNSSKFAQYMFKFKYHLAKFIPFYCVKKYMFKSIHEKFGGRFWGWITGGAPLEMSVGKFFERIGFRVFQGYGLSEASPVVAVNRPERNIMESVGKPLGSLEVRIDSETGELMLKGPSIMKGYYHQEELTAQTVTPEGWLHTGDIAHLDKEGYIYITGRIKNMIVLSGGKKVFPEEVEAVLEKCDNVSEVCVFGSSRTFGAKDGTEEVVAVVVPKESLYDKYTDEEVENIVKADVKSMSLRLTPYKRPTNVVVNKLSLPKTTTRKIKRKAVKELICQ